MHALQVLVTLTVKDNSGALRVRPTKNPKATVKDSCVKRDATAWAEVMDFTGKVVSDQVSYFSGLVHFDVAKGFSVCSALHK